MRKKTCPITPSSPTHLQAGLVQEDDGLSQVGGSLHHIDDTLRADPGQLFRLTLVEQVVQVAQGLLQLQG